MASSISQATSDPLHHVADDDPLELVLELSEPDGVHTESLNLSCQTNHVGQL